MILHYDTGSIICAAFGDQSIEKQGLVKAEYTPEEVEEYEKRIAPRCDYGGYYSADSYIKHFLETEEDRQQAEEEWLRAMDAEDLHNFRERGDTLDPYPL